MIKWIDFLTLLLAFKEQDGVNTEVDIIVVQIS